MKFESYIDDEGRSLLHQFLDSLEREERIDVMSLLYQIQRKGLQASRQKNVIRRMDRDLYQVPIKISKESRFSLYFLTHDDRCIVVHAPLDKNMRSERDALAKAQKGKYNYLNRGGSMSRTVLFDDYLNEQLKDEDVRKEFFLIQKKMAVEVEVVLAREEEGYGQRELARLANLPQSTLARIENGENTSVETLAKIAFALNRELDISFRKKRS